MGSWLVSHIGKHIVCYHLPGTDGDLNDKEATYFFPHTFTQLVAFLTQMSENRWLLEINQISVSPALLQQGSAKKKKNLIFLVQIPISQLE